MNLRPYLILLLSIVLPCGLVYAQETGRVVLNVSEIPSEKGEVRAALFESSDGFPDNFEKGQRLNSSTVSNGVAEIVFTDVPFGEYVLAVFHDENNNGVLDKNNKGIPLEALGVSNNPKLKLGPPKYDRSIFEIKNLELNLNIDLQQYKAGTR